MFHRIFCPSLSIGVDKGEGDVRVYDYVFVPRKGTLDEVPLGCDRGITGDRVTDELQSVGPGRLFGKSVGSPGPAGDDDDLFFGEGDGRLLDYLEDDLSIGERGTSTGADDGDPQLGRHATIIPRFQFRLLFFAELSADFSAKAWASASVKSPQRAAA